MACRPSRSTRDDRAAVGRRLVILHIANKNYSSWSLRPWLALRMMDLDFEERLTPFVGGGEQPAFRTFSPSGKVPCLVVDDIVVWDSLAIIEFVAERHPGLWPADRRARAWARSASAEMHSGFPAIRRYCSMSCGQRVRLASPPPSLAKEWVRIDALWNEGIERFGGPFLAGSDFTAVDAFYAPLAFRIQTYSEDGFGLSGSALGYARRLLQLPPMVAWYEAALAETWRDEDHEAEVLAAGTVWADHRVDA